jgi:hypothetical protein
LPAKPLEHSASIFQAALFNIIISSVPGWSSSFPASSRNSIPPDWWFTLCALHFFWIVLLFEHLLN